MLLVSNVFGMIVGFSEVFGIIIIAAVGATDAAVVVVVAVTAAAHATVVTACSCNHFEFPSCFN